MKADVAPHAPGTLSARQSQKVATRQRVLDAARELFDTVGYEGATIRGIALQAGVSVGSVFTTFASKGEILSQVMQDRLEGLYAELDRVVPHLRGSTADRLRSMYAIHFAFEARHARLFLSHIAAAYDWTLPAAALPYGRNTHLRDLLRDCLIQGVEAGDVDPQADLDQVLELLKAAYAWTYQRIITADADTAALTAHMDRQVGLICEGLRPR